MSDKQYSKYIARIYQAEDAPSAAAKGDAMKAKFPGSDYELVTGAPCGLCADVQGGEKKVRDDIRDWINSH
jgi:hypothetical protein